MVFLQRDAQHILTLLSKVTTLEDRLELNIFYWHVCFGILSLGHL